MNTTEPPGIVLEGFAGPGGWSTGLAMLQRAIGRTLRTVGVEWDTAACKTAHAAGHTRVRADVARFDLTAFAGLVWLLIMSPPCQAWSRSGKRKGILDQEAIFRHAMRVTAARPTWIDYTDAGPLPAGTGGEGGTWHDARSPLVLEVLRWVLAVRPANICLEQVPDVLPFWELIARWLRSRGYSVWVGCLSSERYGVPQTRERAILIASRERAVSAPPATHTAYDSRLADGGKWHGTDGDLFGGGLEPWMSMAEALGWGFDTQPSPTVTAGGTETGGAEVFGNAATMRPLKETVVRTGNNSMVTSRTGSKAGEGGVQPYERPIEHPAPTLDTNVGSKWRLHTNRDQRPDGTRQVIDPAERPAPTLTAKSGGQWVLRTSNSTKGGDRPGGLIRHGDEPCRTIDTSAGQWRLEPMDAQQMIHDRHAGKPAEGTQSVRVTVQEAAILQSFPGDYPWQGAKSAQFRCVGDAVPPLLAAHVIAACLGVQVESVERAA